MRFILKLVAAVCLVLAAQGPALAMVHIDIDLSSPTIRVRSDSGGNYLWPISPGREGHVTPRGVFHPRALYLMVHSAKYGNAPMPHSIFSYGQYAIHGANAVGALGSPASHGCIRLSPGNAATLFAMVQSQGARIHIMGSAGNRVAHARHHHRHGSDRALAHVPVPHAKSHHEWVRQFVGL